MTNMPKRVAVLGGTGLLGIEAATAFMGAGASVVIVARSMPDSEEKIERLGGCEFVLGDVGMSSVLKSALRDVDHVVYAVGTSLPSESNADPVADLQHSLPPVIRLLELLKTQPRTSLTFYSSGGTVYGEPKEIPTSEDSPCNPITSYGVTKLAAEKYIGMYTLLHGIQARVLRVANAYGPFQRAGRSQGVIASFLAAARQGTPVRLFGDGETRRDYIHVSDIARATVDLSCIEGGPSILNVGTGIGLTLNQLLDLMRDLTGIPIEVEHLVSRDIDVRTLVLEVSKLRNSISWDPVTIEKGIIETWNQLSAFSE